MEILFVLAGLVILDISAMIWGADSRERFGSGEWKNRLQRHSFGGKTR